MIVTEDSKPPGESYVPVADFYAGKSIFITGGTGFVGKVLTEKLLYSCPDVGNIYLLVREKKNQSAQERFSSYYDCSMFDRLSKKSPENLKKIKFINGDLTQADVGLSPRDFKILQEEVSIVFHLAATVKFNEPLSAAMRANLEGTEKVLKLCRNMKKIQVFVYMSTIFSYTNHERTMIEERLYPTPMPLHQVYTMIRDSDEKEVFHPDVLDGRPNTYTFTKALAEHLIATERGDIPTVIIRPSIVTPALEEPVKGWVANWMGPTPILYLTGKGWCRCVYGKGDNPLEIIPVDHVVNLTIIAAARYERSAENDIPIYHCCTSSSNPVTIKETDVYFAKACRKQGFNDFPFPGVIVTTSSLVFTVMSFIFQVLPSYIADFFLLITGKPARFVNIQKKVAKAAIATRYFKTQRFLMTNRRSQALFESLSSEDQRTFPCDSTNINWEDYMATYLHGIRKYLLK